MERTIELETRAWVAAGNLIWDFGTIDDEVGDDLLSLSCVIIEGRIQFDCAVGGGVTGREIMEWITVNLQGGPFSQPIVSAVNAWDLCNYLTGMEGVIQGFVGDCAADASYDETLLIFIPMATGLIPECEEMFPLSKAASKLNLKIHLGGAVINANTTVTGAQFDVVCKLHRGHSIRLAHPRCIESFDKELREKLPAATYHGACFMAPTGGFPLVTNIDHVRVIGDGDEIHSSLTPDAVLESYVDDIGYANGMGPAGAIAAGAIEWKADFADLVFFPLLWQSCSLRKNRMSQQVGAQSGLLVDCDGDIGAVRYVTGYVPPIGGVYETKALRQLGVQPSAVSVSREVTPGQLARRPSLAATPFKVDGTSNLSKAGELANTLGAAPVFPKKMAVR